MQIPIIGGSSKHSSKDVNYQRCVNLFYAPSGSNGRGGEGVLLHTPGKQLVCEQAGASSVRALINVNDSVYAVIDNFVYKLTIDDNTMTATLSSSLGELSTVVGRVSAAYNPTQIMIVDGSSSGYIITTATDTFAAITDVDFTGGTSVVFLDSYFIYNEPNSAFMHATAINDGTSIAALDVATAEGNPDKLRTLLVDKRELWAIGERSVEIWFVDPNNATGFPLSRRDGAFVDQGCAAAGSAINVDNTMMWLDNRRYVVMVQQYSPQVISTPDISREFQSYSRVDDAVSYTYVDRGQLFYVISFPTVKKTWAYCLVTQQWHEKAYLNQDDELEADRSYCAVQYKGYYLIGDNQSGKIYVLKDNVYTDNGDPVRRIRTTSPLNVENKQITVDCLELHMEQATAPIGTQGYIYLRYSNDGGYHWSEELPANMGLTGQYAKRVTWNRLGMAKEWMFEFIVQDNIPVVLIDADAEISGES